MSFEYSVPAWKALSHFVGICNQSHKAVAVAAMFVVPSLEDTPRAIPSLRLARQQPSLPGALIRPTWIHDALIALNHQPYDTSHGTSSS